ncbi:erythrocyte membrane protein [Cyclospora cayetanensis]|uniref:Erythrocyte membrane protein n=1 Tax=Cyclospora cayetanensis TaxID=88456 RepID=A0A1D3CT54_9EIME|nr:erythrocyte membrane protein [Cyclospora cayetanensis]
MDGDWGETQKRLLIEESDAWFERHGLRLQLLRLPLPLPPHCKNWGELAAQLQLYPLHLKLLNHERLLAKRIRGNWSFSVCGLSVMTSRAASPRNSPNDPRNRQLPFRLQPLPRAVAAELPLLGRELLSEDFDGLLLTVHSKALKPEASNNKKQVPNTAGVSKVFAGCVIESLASNERQLRALWSFKSVFIDRRDLDLWPRQCWMLLPAIKNFGWPLHYDIKGKTAAVHLDAGVNGSLTCSCHLSRTCLPPSEQATLDRFLMVTEPLLHLLLPPRAERRHLKIERHPLFYRQAAATTSPSPIKRKPGKGRKGGTWSDGVDSAVEERRGWREFIAIQRDEELAREASCLITGCTYVPPPSLFSKEDEWCGLTPEDVVQLVSDCEEVGTTQTHCGAQASARTLANQQAKTSPPARPKRPASQKRSLLRQSASSLPASKAPQSTVQQARAAGTRRSSIGTSEHSARSLGGTQEPPQDAPRSGNSHSSHGGPLDCPKRGHQGSPKHSSYDSRVPEEGPRRGPLWDPQGAPEATEGLGGVAPGVRRSSRVLKKSRQSSP